MSYKKDQKLDNSKFIDEQKVLEEAETRNVAKDVVEKLTESVEGKSTLQDQQEELDKVLDETKKNINKTTNEAKREVSRFAKTIGDLQEQTIQTTKAIGYELVHLQKEAISTQSAYLPYIERSYALSWTPWTSPGIKSEVYTRMVDNFVDNAIATTNLVNNMFLTNMETIQLMMDTTRDYFKLSTDTVKSFKDTLTNPNTNN